MDDASTREIFEAERPQDAITKLKRALWFLIADVEALHLSNPINPPITKQEQENLDHARALVRCYQPDDI